MACGCVLLAYLAAGMFGSGTRTFFSPDTLDGRWEHELLLPLTQTPIYRGGGAAYRWPLVDFLVVRGFWSKSDVSPSRLICISRTNKQWWDGESRFYRELAWRGEDWIQWTEENDALAKVVWPRVLSELRKPGVTNTGGAQRILTAARSARTVEQFEWLTDEPSAGTF